MPTYVYEVVTSEGGEPERFEVDQPISERPVRRILCAPFIGGRWSGSASRASMVDSNLGANGFSKHVNEGDGVYRKACGHHAPSTLRR